MFALDGRLENRLFLSNVLKDYVDYLLELFLGVLEAEAEANTSIQKFTLNLFKDIAFIKSIKSVSMVLCCR